MVVSDRSGDGLPDLIYSSGGVLRTRVHAGDQPDLLTSVTDAFGNVNSFAYVPISYDAYTRGSAAVYPEQDHNGSLPVVHSMTSSNGIGGSYALTYLYMGARLNLQGRGFEGFATRRTEDNETRKVIAAWRTQRGWARKPIPFDRVSPQEMQSLSDEMFDAAGVPKDVVSNYYRALNEYLYGF